MNLRYRIDENGEKVLQFREYERNANGVPDEWQDVPVEEKRTPKSNNILITSDSFDEEINQIMFNGKVFVKRDETLVRLPSVQSLRKNCISGAIQMWENNNTLGEITTYIYDYLKGEK